MPRRRKPSFDRSDISGSENGSVVGERDRLSISSTAEDRLFAGSFFLKTMRLNILSQLDDIKVLGLDVLRLVEVSSGLSQSQL